MTTVVLLADMSNVADCDTMEDALNAAFKWEYENADINNPMGCLSIKRVSDSETMVLVNGHPTYQLLSI